MKNPSLLAVLSQSSYACAIVTWANDDTVPSEKLIKIRKASGLTQRQLAFGMDLHRNSYQKMEKRKLGVRFATYEKAAMTIATVAKKSRTALKTQGQLNQVMENSAKARAEWEVSRRLKAEQAQASAEQLQEMLDRAKERKARLQEDSELCRLFIEEQCVSQPETSILRTPFSLFRLRFEDFLAQEQLKGRSPDLIENYLKSHYGYTSNGIQAITLRDVSVPERERRDPWDEITAASIEDEIQSHRKAGLRRQPYGSPAQATYQSLIDYCLENGLPIPPLPARR